MTNKQMKLKDVFITNERYMKIETIHSAMVEYYSGEEFLITGRRCINVERRMMFCRIAYETITITTSQIGGYIGKDHATVIHLIRRCKELCDAYSQYRNDYERITARVYEEFELLNFGVLAQKSYEI